MRQSKITNFNYNNFNVASSLALYRLNTDSNFAAAVNAALAELFASAPKQWHPDTMRISERSIIVYEGLHPNDTARSARLIYQ